MSFRLRANEFSADGIRRIARRELELAIRTLRGTASEAVRIHNARKHLKKLRALLRLVRCRTGKTFFRTHNHRLRDFGRRLAPMRDAEVARLTLRGLRRSAGTTQAKRALSHLGRRVSTELPHAKRGQVLRGVAADLRKLQGSIRRWPLHGLEWQDLSSTLHGTYRRARIEREHFRLRRDIASLHEWRKRSKDLWYQLLLVHPIARATARKIARQLDALTNTQGLMHDVQLVNDVAQRYYRELAVLERGAVLEITNDKLAEYTGLALAQGRQVFRSTPKDFAAYLRTKPK